MSSSKKDNKKPAKITPLAQYFIDRIRERRLELGISPEKLSREISPFDGDSIVRKIENEFTSNKYTPGTLKKAAYYLGLTMEDILPDTLLPDDTLQDKTKIPILKEMSAKAALRSLLEEGYFDEGRTRYEIREYANRFFDEEKPENFFDPALEDVYYEAKLIKVEADESNKLIRFQRNPTYDPNA
ncbi:hypothetical protein SAMN05660226_01842 [Parapedobacter luteus]|uniref:HTH cro/C1-type domain-containing protein n=2 Tax=Parapedobacter luteus TaxID=623280 RepID=A0A1T5BXN4_9SPHI|nr:hypothetical protein SAMN05660226_01842 [Parapedobacter luteus]